MATSDADLLGRWLDHQDAEAFRQIALRHSAMVYSTCRRILRDAARAEDLTQECFQRLASGAEGTSLRSLGGWLHRVATNLSLKQLRSDRRRKERETRFAAARKADARAATATPEASWSDVQEHVDQAIAELPEEFRQALVLHFLEQQTHKVIARQLGVSRGTVTYRVQQGVEKIRTMLRRRGVLVTTVALVALMGEKLAAGTVPASVVAGLGKMAIAGTGKTAAPVAAGVSILGGAVVVKKLTFGVVVLLGAFFLWRTISESPPEPARTVSAPVVLSARPVSVAPEVEATGAAPVTPSADSMEPASTGGVITGKVFAVATGRPLSGAGVTRERQLENGQFGTLVTTQTDAEGRFRLADLEPGAYRVGRFPFDKGLPPFEEEEAVIITVEERQVVGDIDFPVDLGVHISGRVVDEDGNPVAGAEIEGRDRDDNRSLFLATSAEDGSFEIVGVQPARYFTLEAEKLSASLVSEVLEPQRIDEDGISGLILTLRPTASIAGRLIDTRGNPVVGAWLNPQPPNVKFKFKRMRGRGQGRTDEDGYFEVRGMAPGTYKNYLMIASTQNYILAKTPWHSFDLSWGEEIEGITMVIEADTGLSISGQVLNEEGEEIPNAGLHLVAADGSAVRRARTDPLGYYHAANLPTGAYTVSLAHDNYADMVRRDVLAGSEGVDFTLRSGGVIEGQVVDAISGRPIEEFAVLLFEGPPGHRRRGRGRFEKRRDVSGRFRLEGVEPGPATVIARAAGYGETEVVLPKVVCGETIDRVEIRLEGGASVVGVVVDGRGAPVANAGIVPGGLPQHESPERAAVTRTAEDGTFEVSVLSSSIETLSAFHKDFASASVSLSLAPDTASHVTIVLPAGGVVEGTVYHGDRPWPGQRVSVRQGPGAGSFDSTTDVDGRYRFERLREGAALVLISALSRVDDPPVFGRSMLHLATIRTGESTAVDFRFGSGEAKVRGRVTLRGKPVAASLTMSLAGVPGVEERSTRAPDGTYEFDDVPSGKVAIVARSRKTPRTRRIELEIEGTENLTYDIELEGGLSVSLLAKGLVAGEEAQLHVFAGDLDFDVEIEEFVATLQKHREALVTTANLRGGEPTKLDGLDAGDYTIVALVGPAEGAASSSKTEGRVRSFVVEVTEEVGEVELALE